MGGVEVVVQTAGTGLDGVSEPGGARRRDVLAGLHEVEGGAVVLDLEGGVGGGVGHLAGFLGGDLRRLGVLLQRLLVRLDELGIGLVLIGVRIQLAGCSLQRSERRLLVLGVERVECSLRLLDVSLDASADDLDLRTELLPQVLEPERVLLSGDRVAEGI